MKDVRGERTVAEREIYLADLLSTALSGDSDAADKLSKIALGGYQEARNALDLYDNLGTVSKVGPAKESSLNAWQFTETDKRFFRKHPRESLIARSRQIAVAVEVAPPPITSTYEQFPTLSLGEAVRTLREEEKILKQRRYKLRRGTVLKRLLPPDSDGFLDNL